MKSFHLPFRSILVLAFVLSANSAFSNDTTRVTPIRYFAITSYTPWFSFVGDGSLVDTSGAFYYRDLVAYRTSYFYSMHESDSLLYSERRYQILVFQPGDSHGILYNSPGMSDPIKKVRLDSTINTTNFRKVDIHLNFKLNKYKLLQSRAIPDSGLLYESYEFELTDTSCASSMRMILKYANGLKDWPLSLSKELDSISRRKLVSYTTIVNSHYVDPDNKRREAVLESVYNLIEIPYLERMGIREYFRRYTFDRERLLR